MSKIKLPWVYALPAPSDLVSCAQMVSLDQVLNRDDDIHFNFTDHYDPARLVRSVYSASGVSADLASDGCSFFQDSLIHLEQYAVSDGAACEFAIEILDSAGAKAQAFLGHYLAELWGEEQVDNRDFEIKGGNGGDVWANWLEHPGTGTIGEDTADPYQGARSALITTGPVPTLPGDLAYVFQMVNELIIYTFNKLSFWSKGDGATDGQLSYQGTSSTWRRSTGNSTAAWQEYTETGNSQYNIAEPYLYLRSNEGTTGAQATFDVLSLKRLLADGLAVFPARLPAATGRGWFNIDSGFDANDMASYNIYKV